ncbi:MAG: xanthine phosphoribosyltransferase [Clostridia bacterium]|nr:xanthine phosphoribosyltransferase [Clostridia bacterium]
MERLEQRILQDGVVRPGQVLKVDSFLNHQMDIPFLCEIGQEFFRLFRDSGVTKIVTVEASGIGIACLTAQYFHVPVVFAKKSKTLNISGDVYSTEVMSYTHGRTYTVIISKSFLSAGDKVLLIDDFLANGCAMLGLIDLARQAGAEVVGAGIVIEKGFQRGGELIRQAGVRLESLAVIESMEDDGRITFRH